MTTYQATTRGAVVIRDDGVQVPVDNPEYLAWLAAGNTPLPAAPDQPPFPQDVEDAATFADWAGVIASMRSVADADLLEIATDLTTLNSTGWDNLSAAQRTAAIRRLATRQQHALTAIKRVLGVVAIVGRRWGNG